jgi:membrane protein YdbS with pleckstrin-like domain
MVAGVVVPVLVLGILWVWLRFRLWAFQFRTDHLFLERGVYRNVETVVPYVRIQHVDTSRGPVERVLGLSTLVVYTAGSRGADVAIPGLPAGDAEAMQSRVKELAIEAEGGEGL